MKVVARTNGMNKIHSLVVSDVVTDNLVVAEFTDIPYI